MFGAEDYVSGHVDVNNKRQKVINEAMEKYETWLCKNSSRNVLVNDIITYNNTVPGGPGG